MSSDSEEEYYLGDCWGCSGLVSSKTGNCGMGCRECDECGRYYPLVCGDDFRCNECIPEKCPGCSDMTFKTIKDSFGMRCCRNCPTCNHCTNTNIFEGNEEIFRCISEGCWYNDTDVGICKECAKDISCPGCGINGVLIDPENDYAIPVAELETGGAAVKLETCDASIELGLTTDD
jgi:hypothetical protein